MRVALAGLVAYWVLIASAFVYQVSFGSSAANYLVGLIAMTATLGALLALSWRIKRRWVATLAALTLSGGYLVSLLVVGWGAALDPWMKPDVEIYRGDMVCRAVWGSETEVMVFKRYGLGLERRQADYLIGDARQACQRF
ncbi:hypothetical protein [Dyella silvae]|uniref:hypothetical protein n=1 Tax=Dyella silvae TaxID=2994424 RepID=UPI00226507A3|nr:hypothetical protein [Dyella silvae]